MLARTTRKITDGGKQSDVRVEHPIGPKRTVHHGERINKLIASNESVD